MKMKRCVFDLMQHRRKNASAHFNGSRLQRKLSATVAQSLLGGSQIRIELKDASDKSHGIESVSGRVNSVNTEGMVSVKQPISARQSIYRVGLSGYIRTRGR